MILAQEILNQLILFPLSIIHGCLLPSFLYLTSIKWSTHRLWLLLLWNPHNPLFRHLQLLRLLSLQRMRLFRLNFLSISCILLFLKPRSRVAHISLSFIILLFDLPPGKRVMSNLAPREPPVELLLEVSQFHLHPLIDVSLAGELSTGVGSYITVGQNF